MDAYEINNWIHRLGRDHYPCSLDGNSQKLLRKLFDVLAPICPDPDDERRDLWLRAPRCTFEEYVRHFREENVGDFTKEEIRKLYAEDFPEKEVWYSFHSMRHCVRGDEFMGVFLNHEYVLQIGDLNERGWPVDASELITWLIEEVRKAIGDLQAGVYNRYVSEHLPYRLRSGEILRKAYWDLYPDKRREYQDLLEPGDESAFLALCDTFSDDAGDPLHGAYAEAVTARMYFEACAAGYRAIGRDGAQKHCHFFEETEEEKERYGGGFTPRELYYIYADGRDDGLSSVPLDDADEFADWMKHNGKYSDHFGGGHPWEVIPSFSIEYSLHFSVQRPYERHPQSGLFRYLPGYYFLVSGDTFARSPETIRFCLAVAKCGYPVCVSNWQLMAARLRETDILHVIPETYSFFTNAGDKRGLDSIRLDGYDRIDELIRAITWLPENEVALKSADAPEEEHEDENHSCRKP